MAPTRSAENLAADVDVLIVGAGPAGATTALLLGRYGVPSLVISRHRGTANTPRAHIFNQRAMEVLRDAGVEERAMSLATPTTYMQHTTWRRALAGEEFGRLYAWGNDPKRKGDYELASPCPMTDIPQSVLEPILVEEATKAGAEFRFYSEFVAQETTTDGRIKTTIKDRSSGVQYAVTSRYLLGCDGAKSAVLSSIGVLVIGRQLNTAFNVHIEADLTKYFADCPGALNWILNPDAPGWSSVGNFRMVRPWHEWVVSMHPSLKDGPDDKDPSGDEILSRLHQMIGDDTIPITIKSSFRWTINDQVAQTWQKDNVICFGDATHRHPPINGLGSNTCISDAFNVAWKLAYVLKGRASPKILDTVTTERKPVGDGIVRRANAGMLRHRELWKVIGVSKDEQNQFLALRGENSPGGRDIRQTLHSAIENIDYEHQGLGIQMNQVYINSTMTVIEDGDTAPDFSKLDPIKQQYLSTYPGYHLPHVWLCQPGSRKRLSILDLVGHGDFTLLTGIGGDHWKAAATKLTNSSKVAVKAYIIGFNQDLLDVYGDWSELREVEENGAILVRPDHFIAWRSTSLIDQPYEKLRSVMTTILGSSIIN